MTRESFRDEIVEDIGLRVNNKYNRGQLEHGGNLWDRPALPELRDEITDLVTYAHTLSRQLGVIQSEVVKVRLAIRDMRLEDADKICVSIVDKLMKQQ